jgi:hypothetical protein
MECHRQEGKIIYISEEKKGICTLTSFALEDEPMSQKPCSTSGANVFFIENKILII